MNAVSAYLAQIGSEEATAPVPPPPPARAAACVGRYFNNTTLTGTPALTRTEVVNFDWGACAGHRHRQGQLLGALDRRGEDVRRRRLPLPHDHRRRRAPVGQRRAGDQQLDAARGDDQHEQLDHAGGQHALHDQDGVLRDRPASAVAKLQWRLPSTTSYVSIPREALFGN